MAFDIKNNETVKRSRKFSGKKDKLNIVWGDIRNMENVMSVVREADAVIHLAAIIAPKSEEIPDIAYDVNVGGTRNLIKAIEKLNKEPKFIFGSSVAVFGKNQHLEPPITVNHPVQPTDNYTAHKIECEKMIQSELKKWTILRFSGIMNPYFLPKDFKYMYLVRADDRVEFIHVDDVVTAIINALFNDNILRKILIIAGGPRWQMKWYDMVEQILKIFGLDPPPKQKFSKEPYHLDWYDTTESERLLKYQNKTFDDYLNDLKKTLGLKYYLSKLFKRKIKKQLYSDQPIY